MIKTTDATFQEDVLNSTLPVIAYFSSSKCAPCQMVTPILKDIEKELYGKVKMVKINVEDSSLTAMNYSIRSLPTILFLKDGDYKNSMVGAAPKSEILNFITRNLND